MNMPKSDPELGWPFSIGPIAGHGKGGPLALCRERVQRENDIDHFDIKLYTIFFRGPATGDRLFFSAAINILTTVPSF